MSAATSAELQLRTERSFRVRHYDLAATLSCGQAFRWEQRGDSWSGIVARRWVTLQQRGNTILARTAEPQSDWLWLEEHLQVGVELGTVLATFPKDEPMKNAISRCAGLRLLRQEPWECLASFILSSTKQIVQIRQIIALLSERYGNRLPTLSPAQVAFAFPTPEQIAALTERELRDCKMGFRAPYLRETAKAIVGGELNLEQLRQLELADAREQLLTLPGVGPKIADCVLLFAYGFPTAFPVDVWVMKALRKSYFKNRRVTPAKLRDFSASYFGPHGGYAQQYLFHALRLDEGKASSFTPVN